MEGEVGDFGGGEGGRYGRADAAGADDEGSGACDLLALALEAAHETFAVEHVADQLAVGAELDGVAGAGDAGVGGDLVQQVHGRDLVRHGDEGAVDIGQAEEQPDEGGVIFRPAAHGHDDGVDALFLEIGVVDQRRLEAFRRVAEMGDQLCGAGNHDA